MITVTTYEELTFYIKMFKDGNADLLIIESKGGYGKSTTVDRIMQEIRHLKVLAHMTPLQFYISGYIYRDCPIVFDDLDTLITNKDNVALLKQFAETQKTKEISWFSTSKILKDNSIPKRYETKSRIIIICNSFDIVNKNVSSLADRGFHIIFKPTKQELMSKIKEISIKYSKDIDTTKIIEIIDKHKSFGDISLRTFVKGTFLYKQDKENFKIRLLQDMELNPKLILLDKLLQEYNNDKDRLQVWKEQGFSRATYYRHKQSLKVSPEVKNVKEVVIPIIQKV